MDFCAKCFGYGPTIPAYGHVPDHESAKILLVSQYMYTYQQYGYKMSTLGKLGLGIRKNCSRHDRKVSWMSYKLHFYRFISINFLSYALH